MSPLNQQVRMTMEYPEMNEMIRSLVAHFAEIDPSQPWATVSHLVDYGQLDEAMDVLIATLVRFNVPVDPARREQIRTLMNAFTFTDESRPIYCYLGDPEMLDRMTVVDEPSS